ncbi:MAG: hypothetical protein AABZ08_01550 [Planctomycetota bacterium]
MRACRPSTSNYGTSNLTHVDTSKVAKGSGTLHKEKVGKVTMTQVEAIAKTKINDFNCFDIEASKRIVMGTARNIGIEVDG